MTEHRPAWDELFRGYRQRQADKEREEQRKQELAAWHQAQTLHVMELVREVALERARQFEQQTGSRIEVRWPSRPPINVTPEGPFMSFLSLGMGPREVHMYSHRVTHEAPTLHYVITGSAGHGMGQKRVHGRPGCKIEARAGGGFLLRDLAPPRGTEGGELGVEDLTFRAFESLLCGPPND
ncbi:MAG: hypothetical protein QM778_09260 [Myxococcales bacterium]